MSIWILQKYIQTVDKVSAIERVAADAYAQSLTQAHLCGLVDSFIS